MRRYATADLSTFEDLFERARAGTITVEPVEYPPVSELQSGPVSFALGRTGAMIMHVRPGRCASDEFRLRLLFETGACVFSSPADLGSLLHARTRGGVRDRALGADRARRRHRRDERRARRSRDHVLTRRPPRRPRPGDGRRCPIPVGAARTKHGRFTHSPGRGRSRTVERPANQDADDGEPLGGARTVHPRTGTSARARLERCRRTADKATSGATRVCRPARSFRGR